MATQKCGNIHSFPLAGQGTFTIPPACSLTFNGATFRNNDPKEINHHQPQQPTPILTFSDTAILDNNLDFPDQRPSFVTKNESIIAYAILVLFVAMLTLLTKIVYGLTARYTAKTNNPTNSDPETADNEPSAPTQEPEHNRPEQNIQMYPRHSRILSPFDVENQYNSYKKYVTNNNTTQLSTGNVSLSKSLQDYIMPPTKKSTDEKNNQRVRGAQQEVKPTTSTSPAAPFPPGTGDHAQLRAHLHVPAKSDTRGPPAAQYQTAHSEPTRQAAHDFGSEPNLIHSTATLIPHLLPPSRNGIYPTMVVNDFYESITVIPNSRQLPPVPKIPLRTKDI